MAVGEQFFVALYGQPSGSSMTQACYNLYTRKQGKPMRIMSLPPTDLNLFLHVKRAHLQMLLWKAADQLGPPDVSITEYGWEIQDGLICPSIYSGPPGPPLLMNVISCRCRAEGKACKETKTVASTVLNSAAPCTVSAQPAMRATTHSQRKRTRWKTQHRTNTIMNMTMIVMNRMKMKMTSWLIDG